MSREVDIYPKKGSKIKVPYKLNGRKIDDIIEEQEVMRQRVISEIKMLCATNPKDITPNGIEPFEYISNKSFDLYKKYIDNDHTLNDLYLMNRVEHDEEYFTDDCVWFGCVEAPTSRHLYYDELSHEEKFIESEWSKIHMLICGNPQDVASNQEDCEGSKFEIVDYIDMKVDQILNDLEDSIYQVYVYKEWIDKYWDEVYRPDMKDILS